MQLPVTVLNASTKRDTGKKAQLGNIQAAKVGSFPMPQFRSYMGNLIRLRICIDMDVILMVQAVADIIRTTLGPRSMLKMLLDANGGAR